MLLEATAQTSTCASVVGADSPTHLPAHVQLPALRWRPKLTSPYRRIFNIFHWYIGRVAVVLAVANIYYVRRGRSGC